MSPALALHFFGSPQLILENVPIDISRRSAVALLAYLTVHNSEQVGQKQSREFLSALLWPDYDQSKAYTNLRHTLWEIQKALGPGWLVANRETVSLRAGADLWVDVQQFEALLQQSNQYKDVSPRLPLLTEAVKLYCDHFLNGFRFKTTPTFNEWASAKADALQEKLSIALKSLVEGYCLMNSMEMALPFAQRLVTLNPLDESAHLLLMQIYIQSGLQNAALKQYQVCEKILRQELGLDPQPETRALYKQIRKGEIKRILPVAQTKTIIPQHNLPRHLTTFIGREKELAEIEHLMAEHRLVTLTGSGGIGKSRLALQVGARLLNNFSNGVGWVELASLADPALLAQAICIALEAAPQGGRTALSALTDYLRSKEFLLVLDNCEHLVEACAQLSDVLLQACPNLWILATSREVLGVKGEHIYRVPSLALPDVQGGLQAIKASEAVKLFVERATVILPEFELIETNAPIIVQICRRLNGIPLALELAAARVKVLKAEQIAARLDDAFQLLIGGSRTVLPRHQTLRAMIDWSYRLLPNDERLVLQRLAVFVGGWTLAAAEAVCDCPNVLDLLAHLVDKSLVIVDHNHGDETRYYFLETIRQYAREKLAASGDEERLRASHMKYFMKLTEQADLGWRGPLQVEWYLRLMGERENLRAALDWAEKTNLEANLYLLGKLIGNWYISDYYEGLRRLEAALGNPDSNTYLLARAHALLIKGALLNQFNRFDEEQTVEQECLALYRACGDQTGEIYSLRALANSFSDIGNVPKSIELAQQALELSRSLGDEYKEGAALRTLGLCETDFPRAFANLEQAIEIFRRRKNWLNLVECVGAAGFRAIQSGNLQLAGNFVKEAVLLSRKLKLKPTLGFNLRENARIAFASGKIEQAFADIHESIELFQEIGNRMEYLWARTNLAYFTLWNGDIAEARIIFCETMQQFLIDKVEAGIAFNLEGMANLFAFLGNFEQAAQLIGWTDAARERFEGGRPLFDQANVDKAIATCLAGMEAQAYSVAYRHGQNLSIDEAIAIALLE